MPPDAEAHDEPPLTEASAEPPPTEASASLDVDFAAAVAATRERLIVAVGRSARDAEISLTLLHLTGELASAGAVSADDLRELAAAGIAVGQERRIVWGNIASVLRAVHLEPSEPIAELTEAGRETSRGWRRVTCCGMRQLADQGLASPVCGDCPAG